MHTLQSTNIKWSSNLRSWQKKTLTNYFDKARHLHYLVSSVDLTIDFNYRIWVTKEKYRNSWGNESGGRVRFLGKQWLTRYLVYRALVVDAANTLFHWYQQNAVSITQNLFDELKGIVKEGKVTVNVLVATKQLESFAFKYAMVHFTENQSGNFSEENYGTSIYSGSISAWGI